jgi:hypothetical protein
MVGSKLLIEDRLANSMGSLDNTGLTAVIDCPTVFLVENDASTGHFFGEIADNVWADP